MNNLQFKVGTTLSGSSSMANKLQGQTLTNEAISNVVDNNYTPQTTDTPQSSGFSTGQAVNAGFSALGKVGEQIGGTAGKVMSGISSVGSSVVSLTQAGKAIGGFKNLSGIKKAGSIGAIAGAAADMIGSFMPEKTEYSGDEGQITQTMDTVYDGISDTLSSIPGWGQLAGGIMKGGKLLGQGINALGGGTDGMCVCAGTKVFKANGEITNIEDLQKEDGIIGWSEINRNIAPQIIHDFIEPREKECVEITLKNGIVLRCSFDHPIYNGFKFIPASKLELLSKVAVSDYPKSNTNIKYVEVVSIESIGKQIVYNLQADYDHTYLANNIITHNTTTDAILGSSFLNLTPMGLINGFGGKRADTITKNTDAFETVGSSYSGTNSKVDEALTKSGKKYGLFSSAARQRANQQIAEAKRQQMTVADIADDVQDMRALRTSMSAINGNRRQLQMQGGYDQTAVRAGKHGMSLELLQKARTILKAQKGNKFTDPFENYLQTLPENQQDTANYRVKDYWEFNGKPKDFNEAVQKGMFVEQEDFDDSGKSLGKSWHGYTVAQNPNTGELEFMKSSTHPTIQKELDWYNSDDGTEFRNQYELVKTEPYYKYIKRKTPIKQETPQHKNGGSIIELIDYKELPEFQNGGSIIELIKESTIELVNPDTVPEFQNGGSINVIPDGALHARKHNMEDADNLTKKGIPVVDNEGEQQAEIEKNEVILRLEITQELEKLTKKYYSDNYSQKEKEIFAINPPTPKAGIIL